MDTLIIFKIENILDNTISCIKTKIYLGLLQVQLE